MHINESANDFFDHLTTLVPINVWRFLRTLMSRTDVYLFSGAIRNYFINHKFDSLRDIDFIITDDVNIEELFPDLEIKRNSFGGYKIIIDNLTVDLWMIKNTWALNQGQMKMEFGLLEHLPDTTFFNFSSILYSMKDKQFIIGRQFLRFLRDKKLDVVLASNPYPSLCIVNSFYYSDKFKLKLAKRLKSYILKNYKAQISSFDQIQIKHFGHIVYSTTQLLTYISGLEKG